ncbi:MAG: AzlC family ABC transporter permease [Actinomycetota bacterium]
MWDRQGVRDGIRDVAPMAPPVPVFGLVLGLLISESTVVSRLAGWSSSFIVFGGASQLAAILVLDAGGTALFAIVTILVVNARHAMYSAALQERFQHAPGWFRWVGAYVLVDQVFATSEQRPDSDSLPYRISYFLAAGFFWWALWVVMVGIGVLVGNVVPSSWSLDFAVPLLFLALLINALKDRPGLVAAAVSGVIAVVGRDLEPAGLGLLAGSICGITVAGLLDWRLERRRSAAVGEVAG